MGPALWIGYIPRAPSMNKCTQQLCRAHTCNYEDWGALVFGFGRWWSMELEAEAQGLVLPPVHCM